MTTLNIPVKAIIADDHPLFRAALLQAFKQSVQGSDVVEAQSFDEVKSCLQDLPDVELVFLDLNMPGNDGFYGLTHLRNAHPDILVIMVSASEDAATMQKAIALGASAFIPKSAPLALLSDAIQHVLNGEIWLPAGIEGTDSVPEEDRELAEKLERLSPSQFKVLQLIADGLLNKQIAYELNIRETTVKQHVSAILTKLEVYNRTQAGLIFQQLNRVSDES
jgi:DNA-binding NarL/FixJ family response regulator